MRSIKKAPEPQSLTAFNKGAHINWDDIHLPNNQHVYNDCICQCVLDQEDLCGYTEICLDEGGRHIDHYIKKDLEPGLTFSWNNMVGAIKDSRFGADWKDNNIAAAGYNRSIRRYDNIYDPISDNLAGVFKFSTDGEIEPVNSTDQKAVTTISVFNLNEHSLKERRRQCMENARDMFSGGMTKADIVTYLRGDGFVSAINFELEQL